MIDIDNINEIWQTIARNKTRSILTAFGVFWGIFILVILLSCGNGFRNGIMQQVEGFAANSSFVIPQATSEAYKGYQKGRFWKLEMSDIQAIKTQVDGVDIVSPVVSKYSYSGDDNVFYGVKGGNFSLKGILPNYNEIDRSKIVHGRFINETDIAEARKVCVIGMKVYEDLIGADKDPIGAMIKANGIYYQVVGVIKPYSDNVNISGNNNETVLLPLNTMQRAYNLGDKLDFIIFSAAKGQKISTLQNDVRALLCELHCISPTDNEAILMIDFEQIFKVFETLFTGIAVLIWIVGIGTLMSGVVGVSNIMLVTIKERTREIGIRRALGAKPSLIIKQILEESLLLTVIAGIVGLMIGVAIMAVVANFVDISSEDAVMFVEPNISFVTAISATVIIVLSGLLAGILPAKRAIQIKAIDAIREE